MLFMNDVSKLLLTNIWSLVSTQFILLFFLLGLIKSPNYMQIKIAQHFFKLL